MNRIGMEKWSNYFLATGGAAAALAGLTFVGVSINLTRILSVRLLPNRALCALILLVNILVISTFCLIPGLLLGSLGWWIMISALIAWIMITRMDIIAFKTLEASYRSYFFQNLIYSQAAVLPFFVAAILLLTGSGAGIYWLVPAISFSFIKSLLDSWILLVEINR